MRKKRIADNQFTFSVKTEDPDIFTESVSVFEVKVSCFRRKSCQNHYFETMRIQCFGQGSCFWQLQVQEQPYSIEEKLIIKF